jgi:hypothetical protein
MMEDGNNIYEVNKLVTDEVAKEMSSGLLSTVDKINAIKRKDNLSAPGPDGLTYPILKIEKENVVTTLIRLMKIMLK